MQQALRKWNEEDELKSVEKAEILEYLAFSLYAQGNMRRALREKEISMVLLSDVRQVLKMMIWGIPLLLGRYCS